MTVNRKTSLKTRNDKIRLNPLNLNQLQSLKEKSLRPRDKDKIQRRINNLIAR
jgi:hypothetical protein